MNQGKYIIWSSSPDTSPDGIKEFCRLNAGRYDMTPEAMSSLPLSRIIGFMWNDIQSWRLTAYSALNIPATMPILVIADKSGEEPLSKPEMSCFILDGMNLNQIFDVREGLSTTFYSDGSNIRCKDISEHGTDYYLFREITGLKGLHAFADQVRSGAAFTESELDEFSRSLAPKIHKIYGWPEPGQRPLKTLITEASSRTELQPSLSGKQPELSK